MGLLFDTFDIALRKKEKSKSGGTKMKGNMTRGKLTMPKPSFGSKTFTKPKWSLHASLSGKKHKFKSVLASAGV